MSISILGYIGIWSPQKYIFISFRLGTGEKVRADAAMEGLLASLPAELVSRGGGSAKGGSKSGSLAAVRGSVKPNRAKIGQILRTDSVIDLQRQLLTTVMENEVW